jgi:membrane protease YdiL (CAAX protease family)
MSPSPILIVSTLLTGIIFVVQIAVVVSALANWKHTRAHLGASAVVACAVVILALPAAAVTFLYMDPAALAPQIDRSLAPVVLWGIRIGLVAGHLINAVILLLYLPVAIRLGDPHPFPFLCRRSERLRGIALSAALGCILGVLSALLFLYLRVDPGEFLRKAQKMLPGVDFNAPAYIFGISLPALLSAAIAEELLFRGIIQRWLERKLGGTERSGWIAVALSSALWAVAHMGNVEQVGLKLGQIFILGLVFGTLARKFSVEASIGAHVLLNLLVILVVTGMQLHPFG